MKLLDIVQFGYKVNLLHIQYGLEDLCVLGMHSKPEKWTPNCSVACQEERILCKKSLLDRHLLMPPKLKSITPNPFPFMGQFILNPSR